MKTTKLRQSAKGQTCTFRIPGVCNNDPATVCLCHAPHPEKGMGFKSKTDWWAAYGCSSCHDEMDGRTHRYYKNIPGYADNYVENHPHQIFAWHSAIRETQTRMVKAGLIKV